MNTLLIHLFLALGVAVMISAEEYTAISKKILDSILTNDADEISGVLSGAYYRPDQSKQFAQKFVKALMELPPSTIEQLGNPMGKYKYIGAILDGGAYKREFFYMYYEYASLPNMVATYDNGTSIRLRGLSFGISTNKIIDDFFMTSVDASGFSRRLENGASIFADQ